VEPSTSTSIQEMIKEGRIVEARTLLTMQGSCLDTEELQILNLELEQQHAKAETVIAQAEALEIAGKTEEAKALYESVLLFAVDFPGIRDQIKRLNEALLLTKAVKRRSQRIRQASPPLKDGSAGRRFRVVLGAVLAAGLGATILFLALPKPQLQRLPHSEKISPEVPEPPAIVQSAASSPTPEPARPAPALPEKPPAATSAPTEPAVSPQNVLPRQSPAPLTPPENLAATEPQRALPADNGPKQNDGYTIQPGDSLSLIAERLFCREDLWRKIYKLNRYQIDDPQRLQPGMVLRLDGIESRCPVTHHGQSSLESRPADQKDGSEENTTN
jgi:nucleoid-associated protein YgaU